MIMISPAVRHSPSSLEASYAGLGRRAPVRTARGSTPPATPPAHRRGRLTNRGFLKGWKEDNFTYSSGCCVEYEYNIYIYIYPPGQRPRKTWPFNFAEKDLLLLGPFGSKVKMMAMDVQQ